MKKYFIIGLLGVGCIYAATRCILPNWLSNLFSYRSHDLGHEIVQKKINVDFANALDQENVIDLVVLGSGPGGLMACVYGCRAGHQVVCFEGLEPGGLLTKTTLVENWPGENSILGVDIIRKMREQALERGACFISDSIIKTDFSSYPYRLETEEGLVVYALSVIIATGAKPKYLGIPGEEYFFGRGVTTCATCDAPQYVDKDVVVIGGGDSAVEEAIQLTPFARSVTLMVRGSTMRAAVTMQQRLMQYSNINVRYNVSLQEIVGDATVAGIVVKDNITGAMTQEPIDGVFLAIGHEPNVEIFENQLTLCATGHIALCGRTQQTSVPGVFAAGDVSDNEYRQAGSAAGDGIKAAIDANKFLMMHGYSQIQAQQLDVVRFSPPAREGEALVKSLETVDQFNALISSDSSLVLVDFYAESCSVCMYMLPVLAWAAEHYADIVSIYTIDAERSVDLADYLAVKRVPALLLFKNGSLVEKIFNPLTKRELAVLIENYAK